MPMRDRRRRRNTERASKRKRPMPRSNWLARLSVASFAFFLLKGLAWLGVAWAVVSQNADVE